MDLDRLITKFQTLEQNRDTLVVTLNRHNAERTQLLDEQFAALSEMIAAKPNPSR